MKSPKIPIDLKHVDRRSGFNRRWIKSDYNGRERRRVDDRRDGMPVGDLLVPDDRDTKEKMVGFEKLLVSTTIQLEAITRLLLLKGLMNEEELLEMMNQVQSEYRDKNKI